MGRQVRERPVGWEGRGVGAEAALAWEELAANLRRVSACLGEGEQEVIEHLLDVMYAKPAHVCRVISCSGKVVVGPFRMQGTRS